MSLFVVVFVFKLADIQVVNADELTETALDKRSVPIPTYGIRGDIVDEKGVLLATTDVRYDVQLSPKNVGSFHRALDTNQTKEVSKAEALAEIGAITGQSGEEIQKIVDDALAINPKSDFAYVKRSVDLAALNALKDLSIPWLTFDQNPSRTYPNGAIAGNLVGFVGDDNVPLAGVELSQDACLADQNGEETIERGADGVTIPGTTVKVKDKVDGGTVKLTIDSDLQWQAQQIVNRQVETTGARWGLATVQEVSTGKMRAIAESNTVDPNDVDASAAEDRNSKAYLWPFEPGSTYKTITAAALIDQGLATPTTQVIAPGSYEAPNGARFADSWSHGPIQYTLTGVMVDSSNVGISLLGANMTAETRYSYLKKFGLGEPTNSGLGDESGGQLRPWEEWDYQTTYNTMFGQGLSSTVIQTSDIYQALANGGTRLPAQLVEGCESADGTFTAHDPGEPVQVVSPETAKTTTSILEMLPQDSWLTDRIAIPGYRIAGKTGTAEQVDETGSYGDTYVNSFAGYFPADDPKYVVVFVLGHPEVQMGAPETVNGFRDVAQATIKTYAVPPSTTPAETIPKNF
nr:penicillin-binding protein 2 [Lysinibacter cavernae]